MITLQTPNGVFFDSIVYAEKHLIYGCLEVIDLEELRNFTLAPQEKQADKDSYTLL